MKQGKALIVLLVYIAAMAGAGVYLLKRGDLEGNAPQEVEREGGSKIPSTVYKSDGNSSSETESSNESESSSTEKSQLMQGAEPEALFVYSIIELNSGVLEYKLIDQFTGEIVFERHLVANHPMWGNSAINQNDSVQYHGPTRTVVFGSQNKHDGPGGPYITNPELSYDNAIVMITENSDTPEVIITNEEIEELGSYNFVVHPEKPVLYVLTASPYKLDGPRQSILYEVPIKPNATPKELARIDAYTHGLGLRRNGTLLVTTQEMPLYRKRNPVASMEVGVAPHLYSERPEGVPKECNGCLKLWFISTKTGQTSEVYMTSMNEPYTNGVENLSESAHWYGSYFTLVDVTRDKGMDISVPNMGVHNYYMYWSGDENYLTMQVRPPNAINGAGNRVVIFDNSTKSFIDTPLKEDFFLMDFAPSSRFLLYSTRSDRSLKLYDIETKESRIVLKQKEEASELGGSWVPLLSSS